ncbi:MAG: hypothetical protein IPM53_21205 [Anaerolineaceae bacterium]|nr:hypothetical protein [Anaerolineaceae bacterium]
MNRPESWKTWLPLLGLLVVFALITAVWPSLANAFSLPSLSFGGGTTTAIPYEPEPIHLEAIKTSLAAGPLAAAAEALPDTLSPFVALAVVAGVIIGGVVVVGGGLSFIVRLLSGIRDSTVESEAYRAHQSALEQRQREQLKQMRDGRTTDPMPSHKMPRWSVVSNALITLMFVGFATMVMVRNFFPEGVTEMDGRIVNITTPVFAVFALITLIIMGLRLRPQKIEAVDETDFGKIPWDFIAVLITGLIMLGLGIGFMVYINAG